MERNFNVVISSLTSFLKEKHIAKSNAMSILETNLNNYYIHL